MEDKVNAKKLTYGKLLEKIRNTKAKYIVGIPLVLLKAIYVAIIETPILTVGIFLMLLLLGGISAVEQAIDDIKFLRGKEYE